MKSPLEVLLIAVRVLDDQSIPYVVVGSLASSAHGFSRTTAYIDVVADIQTNHIAKLVAALEPNFYVDEKALRRAVDNYGSFNVINLDSIFKIDFFVPPRDGFGRQQLARREMKAITPDESDIVYVATAEDIILAKLEWDGKGGEVSDRQWSDILGVIKVQGDRINVTYLREWADRLDVRDLLEKSLDEMR